MKDIEVCREPSGRLSYSVGNSGVVFKIIVHGEQKLLKCYTRPKYNLREIYGNKLLANELFIYTDYHSNGRWVDVVMDDWIEGKTLQTGIDEAVESGDITELAMLATKFDRLALELLGRDWAHGDLNPENILIDREGELRLIDFDSVYLPQFAGQTSQELGTLAFQHPLRTIQLFDRTIDDYSIALISTALHAISIDKTILQRYRLEEGLLFNPAEILDHSSVALKEVLELFSERGMTPQYRIALLLYSHTPTLFGLQPLMDYAVNGVRRRADTMEIFVQNGLWGYRRAETLDNHNYEIEGAEADDRVVIPAIYDSGFDFSEGLAAVQTGGKWHFIDLTGHVVIDCHTYDAVKPFRNGRCKVRQASKWYELDRNGNR